MIWTSWAQRALRLAVVLFLVLLLTQAMTLLVPGDLEVMILGENASAEELAQLRQELAIDQPLVLRFLKWLGAAAGGDLGISLQTGQPVAQLIGERFFVSLELVFYAQCLALILALPLSVLAVSNMGGWLDRTCSVVALGFISIPAFSLGLFLILLFALSLGWFPATGYRPWSEGMVAHLSSLFLPAFTLALVEAPVYFRILRTDMIETLGQPFVMTARAKGLPNWAVLTRHVLRPSLVTLITVIGLNVGHLIGGAVIIETLFALPGMGRLLMGAIYAKDLFLVQGLVLVIALVYIIVNMLVDALYLVLNPQVRGVENNR
jgi:peptide/nickel transport system permease protein